MSTLETVLFIVTAWVIGGLAAGLLLGRAIRRREAMIPTGTPGPALPAVPRTAHEQQLALRVELERLLAKMDRADLDGGPDEIADLCRIWTARAATASAEQRLNQAIEQARRNGRDWSTIKIVLELPHPSPLGTTPDHR
ncbi:MAG: hypothetical protein ACT4O0_14705 [Pseudonocardia sp.]